MLTDSEISRFITHGFVPVRGAVASDVAAACVDALWGRLGNRGVRRDDPVTWRRPVVWIACPEGGPFVDAGTSPLLWEAYDQLIGPGRWPPRRGVGGNLPVRFPSEADPGYAGWHIDSGPKGDRYWSSIHSPTRALLALFLFTDVSEDDAPTYLLAGSHLDVAAWPGPAGEEGREWSSLDPHLPASTFQRETALATGAAGDVYLCHPFLVHRASWPHRGLTPRMMSQPSVWLKEPYALDNPEAALPVERAILAGLGAPSSDMVASHHEDARE